MSRKLWFASLVLLLAAAACAAEPPSADFGSGDRFVPQVADSLDNVGQQPSVVVASDGTPFVTYLGFPQDVAAGEVAPPRPIGAPSLPAVLLASEREGVWTRGAVAMVADIPNVDIAFGPAAVKQLDSMTPDNVNGTAMAVDASDKLHVAWAADTGLWYATDAGGSFAAERIMELDPPLNVAGPLGQPSILVDGSGAPWVAYTVTTALGKEVTVATSTGGAWSTDVVARIPLGAGGQPPRTAIALGGDGAPVVFYAGAGSVGAASKSGDRWVTSTVERGAEGVGLSVSTSPDGTILAAYYSGPQIHVAATSGRGAAVVASVADVGEGDNMRGRSTGIGVDDQGRIVVAWYDPSTDEVKAASSTDGSSYSPAQLSSVKGGAQPSVAVAPDGKRVYLSWYDTVDQNLMLGVYGDVTGLAVAARSPTPSAMPAPTASPSAPAAECSPSGTDLKISAQGIAFDTNCLAAPAGTSFTITFDNKDAGVQHNVSIYPSSSDLANPLFRGDLITGPDQITYEVGPLDPGTYYFMCDVHPNMNGTFVVAEAGGGGAGGGGGATGAGGATTTSVTAQGIAFDTGQIALPAGQKVTLTFVNNDAGIQHNISIHASSSDLASPLFRGELVTGVTSVDYEIPPLDPGTYYFMCDVHPNMNGTVVVQ